LQIRSRGGCRVRQNVGGKRKKKDSDEATGFSPPQDFADTHRPGGLIILSVRRAT
jgi:hypothetical protein